MRIATEIRIDKGTNKATADRYAEITQCPADSQHRFSEDRIKTWTLLFVSEIS